MFRRLDRASVIVALTLASTACGDDDAGVAGGSGGSGAGGAASSSTGEPSCEQLPCEPGSHCFEGSCRPCDSTRGAVHDAELLDGDGDGQTRHYFLHVPAAYTCEQAAPLLIDFHGTAIGPRPEEAYNQDDLIALAEREGLVLARPRSLSSLEGGMEVHRWDQNPGDLVRNTELARRLVADLRSRFHVDPERVYASGFSTGANMTAQFFAAEHRGLFRGLAPIGGGLWSGALAIGPFDDEPPRAYFGTGYRDYLYPSLRSLRGKLAAAGYPADRQLFRQLDTGHEMYTLQVDELFAWLDRGEAPASVAGAPLAPWIDEVVPSGTALLTLERNLDGSHWSAAADGRVLERASDGTWSLRSGADVERAWTGACTDADGQRFLVGEGRLRRDLGAGFGAESTLPELGAPAFGHTYANGIACGEAGELLAAGYWSAVGSDDAGASFSDVSIDVGGYAAQAAAARTGPSGVSLVVGYFDYVGRRGVGELDATPVQHPIGARWWTDIASGPAGLWLVAGDGGAILRSTDDGQSFTTVKPEGGAPLWAIALSPSGTTAAAVGHDGEVHVSIDGGQSWVSRPTGYARMLSSVSFIDDATVLVGGEGGLALRASLR